MPPQTLTERAVARAKPRARRYELTCRTVRGFMVRVLPSGKKAYYVRFRTHDGRDVRERIGSIEQVSFADARRQAIARLAASGSDSDRDEPRSTARRALRRAATPTVSQFAARFLAEHVDVRLKPNTRTKYRQVLRTMILPAFGARRLDEVTRAEVIRWHGARRATPYEANHGLVVLRSLYSRALDWDVLPEGFVAPSARVRKFPETPRERFLTRDERARLEAFLDVALTKKWGRGGYRWETICALRLLAYTGMRRGEVLGLRWDMVDWEHGVLRLPDSKVGKRVVPLSPQAVALLESARARENPSPYVVPAETGGPIHGTTLTVSWIRLRRHVGLEDVRLHDLRHSAASDAAGAGVPLLVIAKILGHKKASTTQRYAHIADEALRRGVTLMGETIAAAAAATRAGAPRGRRRAKARRSKE